MLELAHIGSLAFPFRDRMYPPGRSAGEWRLETISRRLERLPGVMGLGGPEGCSNGLLRISHPLVHRGEPCAVTQEPQTEFLSRNVSAPFSGVAVVDVSPGRRNDLLYGNGYSP